MYDLVVSMSVLAFILKIEFIIDWQNSVLENSKMIMSEEVWLLIVSSLHVPHRSVNQQSPRESDQDWTLMKMTVTTSTMRTQQIWC